MFGSALVIRTVTHFQHPCMKNLSCKRCKIAIILTKLSAEKKTTGDNLEAPFSVWWRNPECAAVASMPPCDSLPGRFCWATYTISLRPAAQLQYQHRLQQRPHTYEHTVAWQRDIMGQWPGLGDKCNENPTKIKSLSHYAISFGRNVFIFMPIYSVYICAPRQSKVWAPLQSIS